jgi:diguanylate cyclase (GGDEF)-like protein/PAS domain S-box-containing protein
MTIQRPETEPTASPTPAGSIPANIDVFELAALGMVVTDATGHFRRVNPAFARLVGRSVSELVGMPFSALTSPEDIAPSTAVMRDMATRTIGPTTFDKRYVRPDGSSVWCEMSVRPLTGVDGTVAGFLTQAVDITARKQAEKAGEEERQRLDEAQHIAGLGSFEHDLTTDALQASPQMYRLLGLPASEPMTIAAIMERVHPDDRADLGVAMGRCIKHGTPVELVHRFLQSDGSPGWVHARATRTVGEQGRTKVVGTALDITGLRQAEDALEFQAFHDALTGLANRALFLDRLDHALRQAERRGEPIGVLFMDLDNFKTVNDSLGHPTGDRLLIAVAERLATVTRATDTLGRLGGDEFGLLVESGPMPQTAEDIARRVQEALEAPFHLHDREIAVRVSIGIAVGQPPDEGSGDLMRNADLAMYAAKQGGKAHFRLFRPGMQDEALERLSTIAELRRALDRNELEVFYQPIVNARTRAPTGAEALVRWHHPKRGLLLPREFIDLAESEGLIGTLGDWVLKEACRQAQAWRQDGIVDDSFYVSVNLSARQLAETELVDSVSGALEATGLPPSALILEITESTLMLDFEAGLARLEFLKGLGVRIALDDYGTGYSSLNRLGKLPVDIVKIDKSFVDQLTVSREGRALVQSVLDVTRALGMSSTAEGVEQHAQRVVLEEMECGFFQGYLFSKPLPAAEAARSLQRLRGRQLRSHHGDPRHVAGRRSDARNSAGRRSMPQGSAGRGPHRTSVRQSA